MTRAEVQVNYKIPSEKTWRFASIRLKNLSADAIILNIESKLKIMHPTEKGKIDYKIIGIS